MEVVCRLNTYYTGFVTVSMEDFTELDSDRSQLRLAIKNFNKQWKTIHDDWNDYGNISDVKDELIPLIINTHAAIEDITAHTIVVYVVKDEFATDSFNYFYGQMSQSHRETLLVESGILSKNTRGKLGEFRALRNKVAHGTSERLDWYRDDVPERMNGAFEALDRFTSAFTDQQLIEDIYTGQTKL